MRDSLYVVGLFLFLATLVTGASLVTMWWIVSNPVTVTVQDYEWTLEPLNQTLTKNHYANFTATLTLDGKPINGTTVYLIYDNGTLTGVSAVTNSTGECLLQWNATAKGDYTLEAKCEVS